jgi:hypothetical protein
MKALVLGWLLADPLPADAFTVAARYVDTAVLRLLVAASGGASIVAGVGWRRFGVSCAASCWRSEARVDRLLTPPGRRRPHGPDRRLRQEPPETAKEALSS